MKVFKRFLSALISMAMVFSLMTVSAAEGSVEIVKEADPATMDWTAEEVAYIDFSDITDISLTDGVVGNGIIIKPNNGATSWMASNRVQDGYMLLGKETNTNGADPATYKEGHIYFSLDQTFFPKRAAHYMVKADYFGGGSGTINSGSYITLYYKSLTANESNIKKTFGSTYNSGEIESFYYDLPDANLGQNITGTIKADMRLTTWGGAQLKIKRISVLEYNGIVYPAGKEVRKGTDEEIASFDFSKLTEVPENGVLEGDGLNFYSTQADGSAMASNILENGYLLMGIKAHKATDAETGDVTYANGAAYFKLDLANELKANTPYAVKVEYFGGGLGLNSGSFIDLRYNTVSDGNAQVVKKYLSSTYNSGKDEALYILLPKANLNGSIQSSTCGADFRLETWCGNGTTTGAQLKIKKVSVVKYDGGECNNPALLFSDYSEGKIKGNKALYNMNTGEYTGLAYYNAEQVMVNDKDSKNSFAIVPVYDANGLGTIGFRIPDAIVKAANETVLTVYYWDVGTGDFSFEYNASTSAYKATPSIELTDSQELKSATLTLSDTVFTQAQTGSYDFKLLTRTTDLCIAKVELQSIVKGDIDESGVLESSDIVLMKKALLSADTPDSIYKINADDVVDIRDLVALKKLMA